MDDGVCGFEAGGIIGVMVGFMIGEGLSDDAELADSDEVDNIESSYIPYNKWT